MDFRTKLHNYQELINGELTKRWQYADDYAARLYRAAEYSLMAGGKRLRPILTVATYQLFRTDIAVCLPYAVALEMVHNFSLIHDDLPGIDNDDFRHGRPTNHKQFGEATAILAGDTLLNYAYKVLADDLSHSSAAQLPTKLTVLNEFAGAIDQMAAGEYVDTVDEGRQIDARELEYIHQHKTGALLKLAVRMGAMLGGADETSLAKLTDYADKIGLAFQIKDDILSVTGDAAVMGKPVGNDQAAGKCTYVSQYGLPKARQMLDNLIHEATTALDDFDDSESANFLRQLADYIANRNK